MSSSASENHDDVVVVDIDQILLSPVKAAEKAGVSSGKVKRLSLITSEDLKTPTIAVPTIAVAAGSLAVWGSVLYYGAYKRKVSPLLTFPIMTAACFASFTPVHDGTHSSIAKGPYKKLINNVVGYLSGIPLNLPFGVYRQLHLLHHRYTNTDKDPDAWDAQGPMVLRFFKWFVPDYFWIKSVLTGGVKDAKLLDAALFYLAMFWMVKKLNNKGLAVFKYWFLPQRTVCRLSSSPHHCHITSLPPLAPFFSRLTDALPPFFYRRTGFSCGSSHTCLIARMANTSSMLRIMYTR
jgi:hypothetical protein